ncbi:MAG: DUF3859 domain-containing protein [Hyphomicrobiaceae bacterium]|nr:DUF3859 domain-containing protein [Hyphomicrobiaceae bacterium]
MRLLVGFALWILLAQAAQAQTGVVERVQLVRAGIWIQNPDDSLAPARATDTVPARVGTIFGIEWRAYGRPANGVATVKVKWIYPPPGLRHPVKRSFQATEEFDYDVAFGARNTTYVELHSDYQLIPGSWVLEIAQASQPLLRQEFKLVP